MSERSEHIIKALMPVPLLDSFLTTAMA